MLNLNLIPQEVGDYQEIIRKMASKNSIGGFTIALFLLALLFVTPSISALQKDFTQIGTYGKITLNDCSGIWNGLLCMVGIKSKVAEYTLEKSSDSIIDAYATGTANINDKRKLFIGAEFLNIRGGLEGLRDVQFYILEKETYEEKAPVYKEVCEKDTKNNSDVCRQEISEYKTITKIREVWKPYNYEELEAGTYKWKLEAKKTRINQQVDFILKLTDDLKATEWAWWSSSWSYKKKINITEITGTTAINYSVQINVSYVAGKMNSDFSDLRFVNASETGEYSYWIDTDRTVNSSKAVVYVKIPSLTGGAISSIYVYYGNAGASTTSSIANAFIFGDDFSTNTTSQYTNSLGNCEQVAIQNGYLNLTHNAGANCILAPSVQPSTFGNYSIYTKRRAVIRAGRQDYPIERLTVYMQGIADVSTAGWYYCNFYSPSSASPHNYKIEIEYSGGSTAGYNVVEPGEYNWFYEGCIARHTNVTGYYNNTNYTEKNPTATSSGYYGIGVIFGEIDYDYWFVRKIPTTKDADEPTYVFGAEEEGSDLVITLGTNPINYFNSSSSSVTFNCSSNSSVGILNLTLLINDVNNYTITNTSALQNLSLQTSLNFADGSYNWSCATYDGGDKTKSTTARYFSVDSTAPTITITNPASIIYNYNYTNSLTQNITLNWTVSDTHIGYCWYYNGSTNVTVTCSNNGTNLNITYKNYTIIFYANDSYGNLASSTIYPNFTYTVFENSRTFNSSTIEGSLESFKLNVTTTSAMSSASLIYDSVVYSATIATDSGGNSIVTRQITIPAISANKNDTFYWNLTLASGVVNTTTSNQSISKISPIIISSVCPTGSLPIINFTFYIEGNLTIQNASANYVITYGVSGNSSMTNISSNISNVAGFSVCINNSQPYYDVSYGEVQYYLDGYADRRYYVFSGTRFTNVTMNLGLYLLDSATAVQFTAQTTTLNAYKNYYLSLMRWYPSINDYKIVELAKTDDKGQTVMKLKTNDVDYRVGLYDIYGNLVKLFSPFRLVCITNPCTYNLFVDSSTSDLTTFMNIQSNLSWDRTTKIFTYIFNDPSQATTLMNLSVWRDTGISSLLICSTSSTSYTGVLNCNVSAYTGTLRAEVWRKGSPSNLIAQLIESVKSEFSDVTGGKTVGLIITLSLIILSAFIFMFSPVASIIGIILALIPALYFGSITGIVFVSIAVLGFIVIHFMRRVV